MDHAVRIPEMGVSKVPVSSCVISAICVVHESVTQLTKDVFVPVPCRSLL